MKAKEQKRKEIEAEGKYVAPKISAVLSKEDRKQQKKDMQEARRKAHILRKFRGDLEVEGEEARETNVGSEMSEKFKRKFQEKTDYEEANFVRLPLTKR
jgi:hypothetical protein